MTQPDVEEGVSHAIVIPRAGDLKTAHHAYRLGRVVALYGTVARLRLLGGPDVFLRRADLLIVDLEERK